MESENEQTILLCINYIYNIIEYRSQIELIVLRSEIQHSRSPTARRALRDLCIISCRDFLNISRILSNSLHNSVLAEAGASRAAPSEWYCLHKVASVPVEPSLIWHQREIANHHRHYQAPLPWFLCIWSMLMLKRKHGALIQFCGCSWQLVWQELLGGIFGKPETNTVHWTIWTQTEVPIYLDHSQAAFRVRTMHWSTQKVNVEARAVGRSGRLAKSQPWRCCPGCRGLKLDAAEPPELKFLLY